MWRRKSVPACLGEELVPEVHGRVRRDGQKVLLAVKNIGGETEAAWRHVLEDLLARGLKAPELLIVDGGKDLEAALASL